MTDSTGLTTPSSTPKPKIQRLTLHAAQARAEMVVRAAEFTFGNLQRHPFSLPSTWRAFCASAREWLISWSHQDGWLNEAVAAGNRLTLKAWTETWCRDVEFFMNTLRDSARYDAPYRSAKAYDAFLRRQTAPTAPTTAEASSVAQEVAAEVSQGDAPEVALDGPQTTPEAADAPFEVTPKTTRGFVSGSLEHIQEQLTSLADRVAVLRAVQTRVIQVDEAALMTLASGHNVVIDDIILTPAAVEGETPANVAPSASADVADEVDAILAGRAPQVTAAANDSNILRATRGYRNIDRRSL